MEASRVCIDDGFNVPGAVGGRQRRSPRARVGREATPG